jgi:hypothetical protein
MANCFGSTIFASGLANAAAAGIVHGIGFTKAGIAAGSMAAKMMSATAIASGGGILATSGVAML